MTKPKKQKRASWDKKQFNFLVIEAKKRKKTGQSMRQIARKMTPRRTEGACRQKLFEQGLNCWGGPLAT